MAHRVVNDVAKWDRTKPVCLWVLGSIVTAGSSVVFENGRKGSFLRAMQCGAALAAPENTLDRRLAPNLDWPAAQRTTELLMPSQPCLGPSSCAHNHLAGGCLLECSAFGNSIPPPEGDDFSTFGKHKADCLIKCAPNLTGHLLSPMPNDWMADIGSTWKLLIFSCFLCFPLSVINNCSEGKVTVTRERLRQPNTLGLFLWFLKLRLTHYQKLSDRSEFNVMTF